MGKAPAFQFYPGDWLRDTQVQMSTMETRGVWFELLCNMWFAPQRGKIEGDKTEVCRLLGCDRQVFDRALDEIIRLKIADVTNGNKKVTIINRRMSREQNIRESTRLRVKKHRVTKASNANVTPPSSSPTPSPTSKTTTYTKSFLKFWDKYPRKTAKKEAFKAFKKATDKPPTDELLKIIEQHMETEQWKKDGGDYIPYPATFLNKGMWEDEIETKWHGERKP
jgi:uncharacterized protein YdaU (DUF1376 family)